MEKLPLDTTKDELIATLRKKGIRDQRVLDAVASVPRERFVPAAFKRKAYNDIALPIGLNQTISQPYTVACMTQELDVRPGQKILEIGTGSGYQAAILSAMGAHVVSIERHLGLFEKALVLLDTLGADVECIYGDGSLGHPKSAPYDRIIITAGAPDVPKNLIPQLVVGGSMIVPVGDAQRQRMHVIRRTSATDYSDRILDDEFSFVPLLGEKGWEHRGSGLT